MRVVREKILGFYSRHALGCDFAFFVGGFLFDVFTLSSVDDTFSIVQQLVYLSLIGGVLITELFEDQGRAVIPLRLRGVWQYRKLIVHFCLGSLLSLYSLFFLKSASALSSIFFVLGILGLLIFNELRTARESGAGLKFALWGICVLSFFSMLFPVLLGFVGWVPFLLTIAAGTLGGELGFRGLRARGLELSSVRKQFLWPLRGVAGAFFGLYVLGWIPPVPLSIEQIGIYHKVEKADGKYIVTHEKPWWKFWKVGDQDFRAYPGDQIYVFTRIFSPGNFADEVRLVWSQKDARSGKWQVTDRVPLKITGGRKEGFRGFAFKSNFSDGPWRVAVETTDGREIGRTRFEVERVTDAPPMDRVFTREEY
jgi:hypothetical protein